MNINNYLANINNIYNSELLETYAVKYKKIVVESFHSTKN
jgi:hypothetical protein